jgi:hypothetical protein
MSERKRDALDVRLGKLEREISPPRDLWPDIAAELAASPARPEPAPQHVQRLTRPVRRFDSPRPWQLAAAAVLMVASAAVTYVITQRTFQGQIIAARRAALEQMQPVLPATPASFSTATFGYARLGAEYARTHAELDAQFTRYLATLPDAERIKVERSLSDLRRAAGELSKQLAEHPSDPLLQELLLSTYQNEIGLLTRVNNAALGVDL